MAQINEVILKNLLDILSKHWESRKSEINKYWDFYTGENQRLYLPQFDGEDADDYAERIRAAVIENHCRSACDVAVGYLYGMGYKISRRAEDELLQQILRDRIWKTNHMWSFGIQRALMTSVTGFCVVALELVDMRTRLPFPPTTSQNEINRYASIRYRILDSADTMPIPRPGFEDELGGILRYYITDNFSGSAVFERLNYKRFETKEVVEFIDDEVWYKWVDEQPEQVVPRNRNPYGDIRIPFVLFRNPGDPMALEGLPDHFDIIPLNIDLNERLNDDRNVISFHSFPVIKFLRGAKMPRNWKRGPASGLEFDGDGDAEYLTWDNVLTASMDREEKLRQAMSRVSGYSDISKGDTERIGQIRSGAGLRTLFLNDMLSTIIRQAYAQLGEQHLIEATAKMLEYHTNLKFSSYESEVSFPEDFIGIDEWLRWQIDRDKLDAGVKGLDEVIEKEHPELISSEEITKRIRQNLQYPRPSRTSRKEEEPDVKSLEQEV